MIPPERFPALLRHAVHEFGGARVWKVGLEVLGYPPTWVRKFSEARQVLAAL